MNQPNPYAAPSSVIEDDGGVSQDPWGGNALATRGSRLAAVIIDGLLGGVLGIIAAVIAPMMVDSMGPDAAAMATMALVGLLLIPLVGYNIYLLHKNGQTIGKKIMNIKIVRSDRSTRASLGRIIGLRVIPMSLAGMIPFLGALVQLADPLFIFGAEQRCLHDYIADTTVIVDGGAYNDIDAYEPTPGPDMYGSGPSGGGLDSTGTDGQFGPGGSGPSSNDDVSW